MSSFSCPVVRIRAVEEHPNADKLNLNYIGEFICISNKKDDGSARYKPGDRVVYMPEASVLPDQLLFRLGFWKEDEKGVGKGTLNGSRGNRIKAMKLRGIVSQGVIMPLAEAVEFGQKIIHEGDPGAVLSGTIPEDYDMSWWLGVTKYEPPIPVHMAGQVCNIHGKTLSYDIENLKRYPDAFNEGEHVQITEKTHGTNCQIGIIPGLNHPDLPGDWYVASKGLGAQGFVFKNNEENKDNLYLKTIKKLGIIEKLRSDAMIDGVLNAGGSIYLLGEIYGLGVQDLAYGTKEPEFAAFDLYYKAPDTSWYFNAGFKRDIFARIGLRAVNLLYEGPYSKEIVEEHTNGKTTMGGDHIREGVVITPLIERRDDRFGRLILKSVSADYLLRKGNTTEFA